MKNKKIFIILLVVALLVVYYLLGTGYLKQQRQHLALASQLASDTAALAQIPGPPADLEQRLEAANVTLETAKKILPARMSSTQIVNAILRLAEECEVKAIPLVTQPWTTQELGDHGCSVFRFSVAVTGTFDRLTSYLSKLENGELKTLIVENTSVNRVFEEPGETVYPPGVIPVNASLDLAIYTQPLPSDIHQKD